MFVIHFIARFHFHGRPFHSTSLKILNYRPITFADCVFAGVFCSVIFLFKSIEALTFWLQPFVGQSQLGLVLQFFDGWNLIELFSVNLNSAVEPHWQQCPRVWQTESFLRSDIIFYTLEEKEPKCVTVQIISLDKLWFRSGFYLAPFDTQFTLSIFSQLASVSS